MVDDDQQGSSTTPATLTRRGFAAGGLSLAALVAGSQQANAETDFRPAGTTTASFAHKPNILVIMADDLGWGDLSCFGAPHIKTPHLDRLAGEGVRFTQAYSGSSTCSPTRISLYTGRYPGRLQGGLAEPIRFVNETEGLPPEHPTLASLLGEAGYSTMLLGKWHCGALPWFSPLKSGYDEWFGNFSGGLDYFSKVSSIPGAGAVYDLYENDVEYHDLGYYTDLLTERSVEFIERDHRGTPWLLNLNYTTPHWPWEGPGDRDVSDDLTARARSGTEPLAMFHYDGGSVAKYVEMVQNMDEHIGRVMAALRRTGQHRDTLVIFKSDNGGERYSYQWPLTGSKFDLLEGGIRVPTIVRWPSRLRGRQVSHLPVVTMDWTRTLLTVAGTRPHPDHPMDGRDLSDYLWGSGADPQGDLVWRVVDQGALRRGDWKYWCANDADRVVTQEKLFNLAQDQSENADVARHHPDLLVELREAYQAEEATLLRYPPGAVRF